MRTQAELEKFAQDLEDKDDQIEAGRRRNADLDADLAAAERVRRQVQQIASGLLDQSATPVIRAQQHLFDEVAGDQWWVDVTVPMLELMRRRLRALVKLLAKSKQVIVSNDIADEVGELKEIDPHRVAVGVDADRFRAKARQYLQAHLDHVALQKVRRNRQLTTGDLSAQEQMLVDARVGDPEDLARASEQAHGFGPFMRSLVALERDVAAEAFSRFVSARTYTRAQVDFVWVVVTRLTEQGVMDVARLYKPPFTDHTPHGPDDLFSGSDVDGLVDALTAIRATVGPAEGVA